jgi:hypothetical protein
MVISYFEVGMAAFSVVSILSGGRLLTGGWLLSKEMADLLMPLMMAWGYLAFFCSSAAAFILRLASEGLIGFDFLRRSFHTFSALLFSNGLGGSDFVAVDFIKHKYAKLFPLLFNLYSNIVPLHLRLQPLLARFAFYRLRFLKLLKETFSYCCKLFEWSKISLLDTRGSPSICLYHPCECLQVLTAKYRQDQSKDLFGIYQFQSPCPTIKNQPETSGLGNPGWFD